MITVYADDHNQHAGLTDPRGDKWDPSDECPERANNVVAEIRAQNFGSLIQPTQFDEHRLTRIHAADYVDFLKTIWRDWVASGRGNVSARPDTFIGDGMRYVDTDNVRARLGRYSFDSMTPFVEGSWKAIRTAANIALTGAELLSNGEQRAFALCRPPGHHATANCCGGYCYLNNAALAAQSLLDNGAEKVAILDVDYHHGNGTQSIFYERNDVLTISLHANPKVEYPYFLGHADETGAHNGHGFNVNYPLPLGTDWQQYQVALADALGKIERFTPDALIVSLGLDTFAGDPTTYFEIASEEFRLIGKAIATIHAPILTVLEGGYSVDYIGQNTVNALSGLA